MPKLLPQIVLADRTIQRASGGRVTVLDIAGLPNLVLTVKGRKTGEPRSTPLLYVPNGDTVLIAGSYFGGPKEPVWVKNIEADPHITVQRKRRTEAMVARRLDGEERAAAWRVMLETWPNFAKYEERTDRTIKVFELSPP